MSKYLSLKHLYTDIKKTIALAGAIQNFDFSGAIWRGFRGGGTHKLCQNICHVLCQQHGRAELRADYCVSNTATQVRLRLQAACLVAYAGS